MGGGAMGRAVPGKPRVAHTNRAQTDARRAAVMVLDLSVYAKPSHFLPRRLQWRMFFKHAIAALSESGAKYCVVGGFAVSLHGIPRMTYDLDIVVLMDAANLARVDRALRSLGLAPRAPVELAAFADDEVRREWLMERNLMALSYGDSADPLREVDVLVSPPVDSVSDVVARAKHVAVGNLTVPLVAIPDLIQMKRRSDRAQDLADVAHLEQLVAGDA
jgi:hypothetical protein